MEGRKAARLPEEYRESLVTDLRADQVTAFMLASTVWDYRQPRSTFEDLKATGNLALLGDMGLRIECVR
jgi:hypothetical protein